MYIGLGHKVDSSPCALRCDIDQPVTWYMVYL